jgi:hypothetical protein
MYSCITNNKKSLTFLSATGIIATLLFLSSIIPNSLLTGSSSKLSETITAPLLENAFAQGGCPPGQHYDTIEGLCVPVEDSPVEDSPVEDPATVGGCPQGQHYDTIEGLCVPDQPTPTPCSQGQHYDTIEGLCVPDQPTPTPCSQGQHYDTIEGLCVPDQPTPIKYASLSVLVKVKGGPAVTSDFNVEISSDDAIDIMPSSFTGSESGTNVAFFINREVTSVSEINYVVNEKLNGDYSLPGYSAELSEGCRGTLGRGGQVTCTITNYYDEGPESPLDFQIVANPEQLTIEPGSSGFSTISLSALADSSTSNENGIKIKLSSEWIGKSPDSDNVRIAFGGEPASLVRDQKEDIGLTVQTSQSAPAGETFTLNVKADGLDKSSYRVSHTANIQITIGPAPINNNNPPKAIAALDKAEVNEGVGVKLDGTQSSDPDGDTLTYWWEIIKGPENAGLADSESDKPVITYASPHIDKDTSIRFQLTVSDGKEGGIDTDTIALGINDLDTNPGPRIFPTIPIPDQIKPIVDSLPVINSTIPIPDQIKPIVKPIVDSLPGIYPTDYSQPSKGNMFPLLVLGSIIIVIGGVAIGLHKVSQRGRRLKIPPSAEVEINTKGGMRE